MEAWIPLMQIFLNSPCPETDASLWLQKSFNSSSNTVTISTTSFLSLLTKPIDLPLTGPSSSSAQEKSVMWIQTLPNAVQVRILSFLAYDHQRFCKMDLCKLARRMLSEGRDLDFWVKKAAEQLLDLVSVSNYQWVSHFNLDSEEENVEDEFLLVPDWLRDAAKENELMLPWLPISHDELSQKLPFGVNRGREDDMLIDVKEDKVEDCDEVMEEVVLSQLKVDDPINHEVIDKATLLKARISNVEATSKAAELAEEIYKLCRESRGISLAVLGLIEPWNADDETASVLISHFSVERDGDEPGWQSHILCSIILPKLLVLNEPASRMLVTATVEFCKAHPTAAEYGLLFPLFLRDQGVNNPMCDIITRIVKECLHPAHASAFFQKLLCGNADTGKIICLPGHNSLIRGKLVWTESLFNLFQNMLNHNIHLTQDSVDQLVHQVCSLVGRYTNSLKYGNFLLCLVNKCAHLLKPHKLLLTGAAQNTDTLVTKSILSKLSNL